MESATPTEDELTDDLIDYIRSSTIQIASKRLPTHVDLNDVVQHVLLCFVSRPPKFDRSRGANIKTLLYVIVQRQFWKYIASLKQLGCEQAFDADLHGVGYRDDEPNFDQPSFMDYIDCEETRRMCLLMMEHAHNFTEVACCMDVTEGTIRYRLKMLQSKLRAAGFDPFVETD